MLNPNSRLAAQVFSKPTSLATSPYFVLALEPAVHTRRLNWQSAEWAASRLLIGTGCPLEMWFVILAEFHKWAASK